MVFTMKISKSIVYATIYSILIFLFSIYLLPHGVDGDQLYYREFYNSCFSENYTYEQEFFCYQNTLGSTEPGYFLLSKLANFLLIEKDLFIAIANSILTFSIVTLVFKYYKPVWHRHLFVVLILSNYYFLVLLTSAERLKFGFIFLTLGLIFAARKRLALFGLAVFSHVQVAIMLIPYFISQVLAKGASKLVKAFTIIGGVVLFAGMLYFMQGHITSKVEAYTSIDGGSVGFLGALKASVFIILALISTRQIIAATAGTPIVVMAYFLGSDRVGMLAFILYAGLVIYYKNRIDLILLIVMLYFSYKSIDFITNILLYGNGYYKLIS